MRRVVVFSLAVVRGLAIALLLCTSFCANAQDLIIKLDGDTIHCKVRGMDDTGIFYRHMVGVHVEDAYIPRYVVKEVLKGATDERLVEGKRLRELHDHPTFHLRLNAGPAWFTGGIDESGEDWEEDFQRELRSGSSYGLDLHFYVSRQVALGLQASWFHTKYALNNVAFYFDDGTVALGTISEDMHISFIGPSLLIEPDLGGSRVHLLANVAVGLAELNDEVVFLAPVQIFGHGLGMRVGLIGEYRLDNGLGLGLLTEGVMANISTDGNLDYSADVSRWGLGVTISYCH